METLAGKVQLVEERQGSRGPYTYLELENGKYPERFYVFSALGKSVLQEFKSGQAVEVKFERKDGNKKDVQSVVPFSGTITPKTFNKPAGTSGGGGYNKGKSPEEQQRIEDGMVFNKVMDVLAHNPGAQSEETVREAVETFYEVKRQMENARKNGVKAAVPITE